MSHSPNNNIEAVKTRSRMPEVAMLILVLITINLFCFFVIVPSIESYFSVLFLIFSELAVLLLIVRFIESENIPENERIHRISVVAEKIRRRSQHNELQPMRLAFIPKEIRPIIESLNHMIESIDTKTRQEIDFVSSASHELRTPLAGIKLQTQIAQRAKDEIERKQALDKVVKSINRAESLINQLLILHRLEPDIMKGAFKKVDLVKVLEQEMAELAPQALRKKVNIGINFGSKGMILGNKESLGVLLNNILRNAINYAPDKTGKVEVFVTTDKKNVEVMIQDNGIGIPREERENVLKRFYKIQKGNKGGTGLGLSIAKRIADLHDAVIKFEDAVNVDGSAQKGLAAKIIFKALE